MVDQRSKFKKTFAELAALQDVKIEQTRIQSHNSLGIDEIYHEPRRNTFREQKKEHTEVDSDQLLAFSTKAINGTLGSEDFLPSALGFGDFPSLWSYLGANTPRSTFSERAIVSQKA